MWFTKYLDFLRSSLLKLEFFPGLFNHNSVTRVNKCWLDSVHMSRRPLCWFSHFIITSNVFLVCSNEYAPTCYPSFVGGSPPSLSSVTCNPHPAGCYLQGSTLPIRQVCQPASQPVSQTVSQLVAWFSPLFLFRFSLFVSFLFSLLLFLTQIPTCLVACSGWFFVCMLLPLSLPWHTNVAIYIYIYLYSIQFQSQY